MSTVSFPLAMDAYSPGAGRSLPPGGAGVEKNEIKRQLVSAIGAIIRDRGLTQGRAAALMGVSQPRISDAVRGKVEKFTIDALVEMLTRSGCRIGVLICRDDPAS
ncbi:MAG: XRE family transcriptional regulator [Desulfovibrio sp.]|nr:XRE family transcriptional regulator [Desulfovibrio sp.]